MTALQFSKCQISEENLAARPLFWAFSQLHCWVVFVGGELGRCLPRSLCYYAPGCSNTKGWCFCFVAGRNLGQFESGDLPGRFSESGGKGP